MVYWCTVYSVLCCSALVDMHVVPTHECMPRMACMHIWVLCYTASQWCIPLYLTIAELWALLVDMLLDSSVDTYTLQVLWDRRSS